MVEHVLHIRVRRAPQPAPRKLVGDGYRYAHGRLGGGRATSHVFGVAVADSGDRHVGRHAVAPSRRPAAAAAAAAAVPPSTPPPPATCTKPKSTPTPTQAQNVGVGSSVSLYGAAVAAVAAIAAVAAAAAHAHADDATSAVPTASETSPLWNRIGLVSTYGRMWFVFYENGSPSIKVSLISTIHTTARHCAEAVAEALPKIF